MAVNLTFLKASTFQETVNQPNSYLYKDLSFDLEPEYSTIPGTLKTNNIVDLKPLTDASAVVNSLKNILLTSPGQKILNPTFGLDLRRFLFYPVNSRIGYLIGLEFSEKLPIYEPRIQINTVNVGLLPDDNTYEIGVSFTIPLLTGSRIFSLKGKLNSDGYTII